ncbi:SMEK domain-containing protein, partial [Flavobacterium psychrophilum]
MNRTLYFNYIVDKIGILSYNINQKGKLNILDLHNHSENFYSYFLSKVFGWELVNLNPIQQNIEAIDLIDHKNKIVLQVSATNTKQKLESSLSKKIISKYSSYTFKFVLISKESTDLIKGTFLNPH